MSVKSTSGVYALYCCKLWRIKAVTLSMNTSFDVSLSYTSANLQDLASRSSAHSCDVMVNDFIKQSIDASKLATDWSVANFLRR